MWSASLIEVNQLYRNVPWIEIVRDLTNCDARGLHWFSLLFQCVELHWLYCIKNVLLSYIVTIFSAYLSGLEEI